MTIKQQPIALVTGASSGIGYAIAKELMPRYQVVATVTTKEKAHILQAKLATFGACQVLVADFSKDSKALEAQIQQLNPVVLVNNAGVTSDNLLLRMSDSDWHTVLQVNLSTAFSLAKACIKGMLKHKWGRIINLSSIVACTGNPGQANYCASKAGLLGLTKSIALEVAKRNITVNAIAPGFITTKMTEQLTKAQHEQMMNKIPMGRFGKPEEVAKLAGFLASEDAGYITGQTLHVNGGMYTN